MKRIYEVANKFIKKISSYFPTEESVKPIIETQLNFLKNKFTNLNGVKDVAMVELQTDISNNVNVYFQVDVDPDKYNNIIKDSANINELIRIHLIPVLESKYTGFKFKTRIGFFPN